MCERIKVAFACGHQLPPQIKRCKRRDCDDVIKFKDVYDDDCEDCFEAGETCTRGRDGLGLHGKRIRKAAEKAARERRQTEGETYADDSDVPANVRPWLESLPNEHQWDKSRYRRRADAEWVREHERRESGDEDELHLEVQELKLSSDHSSVRSRRQDNTRGRRCSSHRGEYDDYKDDHRERYSSHREHRRDTHRHTPSYGGTRMAHHKQTVYDTGFAGPISTTQIAYHYAQPPSPAHASTYTYGSSYGSSYAYPASGYGSPVSYGGSGYGSYSGGY